MDPEEILLEATIYHISRPFLALLDYVSGAHEIEIFRRPSVRPCRNYL